MARHGDRCKGQDLPVHEKRSAVFRTAPVLDSFGGVSVRLKSWPRRVRGQPRSLRDQSGRRGQPGHRDRLGRLPPGQNLRRDEKQTSESEASWITLPLLLPPCPHSPSSAENEVSTTPDTKFTPMCRRVVNADRFTGGGLPVTSQSVSRAIDGLELLLPPAAAAAAADP